MDNAPNTTPQSIAVIGGGIAGCATAYALAEQGFEVTIFEKDHQLAMGASGNPAAMLYPRLSGQNLHSHFALSAFHYSLSLYHSLGLAKNEFQQCGLLQLGFNDKEQLRIQKVIKAYPNAVKKITASEATNIANTDIKYDALYFADAGWITPQSVCQKLTLHRNINVKTDTKVASFTDENNTIILTTSSNHQLRFNHIVLCNACAANQFIQSKYLTMDKVSGQISLLNATAESAKIKTIICSNGYLSPAINIQHSLGATFNTDADSQTTEISEHQTNLNRLLDLAPQLITKFKASECKARIGTRAIASDRLPMVGNLINHDLLIAKRPRPSLKKNELPWQRHVWVNIAHGSHGFINAPYCAHLLSLMITKRLDIKAKDTLTHLNPNRFLFKSLGLKQLARTMACSETSPLHFSSPSFLT